MKHTNIYLYTIKKKTKLFIFSALYTFELSFQGVYI